MQVRHVSFFEVVDMLEESNVGAEAGMGSVAAEGADGIGAVQVCCSSCTVLVSVPNATPVPIQKNSLILCRF